MTSAPSKYPEIRMLIGGEWRARPGQPVTNPSTGEVLGTVPHATTADLHDVVEHYTVVKTVSHLTT